MKSMSYAMQMKHPNWQRKRLEVLEAAGFACSSCWDTESPLHVHHKRYVKGRLAWEYPNEELECLCETCHEEEHQRLLTFGRAVAVMPLNHEPGSFKFFARVACGWSCEELGLQQSLQMAGGDAYELAHAVGHLAKELACAGPEEAWTVHAIRQLAGVPADEEFIKRLSELCKEARERCKDRMRTTKGSG